MAIKTIQTTDFQKTGITDSLRASSGFGMVAGFDTTRAEKLMPTSDLRVSTHPSETITDINIQAFAQSEAVMYGLGVNGSAPALYNWDEVNNRWTTHATFSTTGLADNIIVPYKDYFYGAMKGTHVWRGEIDGSPVPAQWQSLAYTNFADIIHHVADDRLYFLYDNYIGTYDGSTFTAQSLTLPTAFIQTSGTQTPNFLLSGGYNKNTNKSVVYWWDRDSGLDTVSGKNIIDIGRVKHVMRTGGNPIAISLVDGSGMVQAPAKPEMRIYSLSQTEATLVNRIQADNIAIGQKWEYDDRAYFGLTITKDGSTYRGIAEIDEYGRITLEYNNDDATENINAVAISGGQAWTTTNNSYTFNTTDSFADAKVLETRMYRPEKLNTSYDLIGATIRSEPLPENATITLKYRNKVSDSFTTLYTWTQDDDVSHSITKSACTNKPDISAEMQFRLEVVGNVDITGINISLNETKKSSYDA